jgi:ketosteroid isomerase-like protein
MSRAEIQSWLRRFYDARRRNDAANCAALFAGTATMRIVASGRLGGLGDLHQGAQALQTVARALCAEWDFSEMSPDMILIDGSRAAVRNAGQLRHVPTGRKESFAVMDIFHFEDGQCISLEEYADTWAILNLSNPP